MSVNFCSVCRIEKSDSKWWNISEKGKEKAELVGNYELKIGEKICSKCYNFYMAYDRNNRYYKIWIITIIYNMTGMNNTKKT